MSELNLLPNMAKFQAAKIKAKKQVKMISMAVAGLWVFSVMAAFGFWFVNLKRLDLEQKRYDRAMLEFQDLKTEIMLTQQLKYKAKQVGEVMNGRFEYSSVFQLVRNLFSQNIIVEKTEIKSQDVIAINGRVATKISDLDEVEEKINKTNKGMLDGFEKINLSSLVLDNSGWKFAMEVVLK